MLSGYLPGVVGVGLGMMGINDLEGCGMGRKLDENYLLKRLDKFYILWYGRARLND